VNSLLLRALRCENSSRPPIWLMRQAGRYMPEYRAIRAKHSFMEMCRNPELVAEVTQLPIKVFGFDAAILFSDILVIADALGVGLRFEEGAGPVIERPITSVQDIDALLIPDIEEVLGYVSQGIRLLRPQLDVPLIGFSGAPFTVASYMIEGGSSRDLRKTKKWLVRDPESFHKLLDRIAMSTIDYLNMQIDAGVQALQIFDSWAHVLGPAHFREFSLKYLQKLLAGLKDSSVPVILFCRGSSIFAPQMAEIKPAAISIDWNADLNVLRTMVPRPIALQGNLDPDILYGSREQIHQEVDRILESMQGDEGYIFNLGHGIHPDTPTEAVRWLVERVQA
jgi:uroporphyrinogen decarboxylase